MTRRKGPDSRVCVVCGAIFPNNRTAVTCSVPCRKANRREYEARYRAARAQHLKGYLQKYRREHRDWLNGLARARRQKNKADPAWVEREREYHRLSKRRAAALRYEVTRAPRECPQCGLIFRPERRADQIFCSRICAKRSSNERLRSERNRRQRESYRGARYFMEARPCLVCGTPFTPFRSDGVYCSRRCNGRAQIRIYGMRVNPRIDPPELVAIAKAIKETKALLQTYKEETP